jgi:hypothetical protein
MRLGRDLIWYRTASCTAILSVEEHVKVEN